MIGAPRRARRSPDTVLVHNSSAGACYPIIRQVTEGWELWPLLWFLDESCPLVLFFGAHEFCQMAINPHQEHSHVEDDAPRTVSGVQPGSFYSQKDQQVIFGNSSWPGVWAEQGCNQRWWWSCGPNSPDGLRRWMLAGQEIAKMTACRVQEMSRDQT